MKSRLGTAATWAAIGAGAAYFLDPDQGRARRARTSDQAGARWRRTVREVERKARYERGKAQGAWHRARSGERARPADDHVLADRVRSEVLGRSGQVSHVNVEAVDGVVTLRGELADAGAIDRLCAEVAAVPGVREVANLLHVPGEPAPNKEAARHAV